MKPRLMSGLIRLALTGIVAVCLYVGWSPAQAPFAYGAVGIAAVLGLLLVVNRPLYLAHAPLAHALSDSVLIGVLVADTGGAGSLFSYLYPLAALQLAWIRSTSKSVAATVALVGGYVLAAAVAGTYTWSAVGLRAGLLALACSIAVSLGSEVRRSLRRERGLSAALAAEQIRTERADSALFGSGPPLGMLSLEVALHWTAGVARTVTGASYAHVAALRGNHHATVSGTDSDACPSWWNPSLQRLVLWSCREESTVRQDETVHGIEGFMAVPIAAADGDGWGAVVVGGGAFGAEEERALWRLAEAVGPALERPADNLGGIDEVSGLPGKASLDRALRHGLLRGEHLTAFAVGLSVDAEHEAALDSAAWDTLLRRAGTELAGGRRVFRYGDTTFVVLARASDEGFARRTALTLRRLVLREAERIGYPSVDAAVGFAISDVEGGYSDTFLETAVGTLADARATKERVAGGSAWIGPPASSEENALRTGSLRILMRAMKARDAYLGQHASGVARMALRIGRAMSLDHDQMDAILVGALLHDVGKIGIPDRILFKRGPLSEEEYETIRGHPVLGVKIVSTAADLAPALPVIRHHHERFDGRGYPDGLRGEETPLIARVVSAADAYDSMIRDRPYGPGVPVELALEEIRRHAGSQFDPEIVDALLRATGRDGRPRAYFAG